MAAIAQFGAVTEPAHPPPLPPEPIAAGLGIEYPFPPHLEYAYPPPDGNILTNIVNALIAAPRFYTQVLHLMNKMNLPAPFRPALPTPPLPNPNPAPPPHPALKRQAGDLSSGESELESSEDEVEEEEEQEEENEDEAMGLDGSSPVAPKTGRKKGQARKRAKVGAILGPAADKGASHEAAGVKAIVIPKGATLIKKKAPVLQIRIVPKGNTSEAEPRRSTEEGKALPEPIQAEEQEPTASREELEAGKMQQSEMLTLPIFKKYAPGNPTPVLYIKNLAKDVTPDDMVYIFGAFFPSRAVAVEQLNVKVMQEGRMRGQAFVCLPSTELAVVALAGTHGFVFKGKPMVVQYGKNSNVSEESRK